jgi:hypothetical protein
MRRALAVVLLFVLILLGLVACGATMVQDTPMPAYGLIAATPQGTMDPSTLESVLTQQKNNADYQAAATSEVLRIQAQSTLNSANATLGALQTQEQVDANYIAAQIAATAEIVRANAQATLNSAWSTQYAALTMDAIRQTQAQNDQQVIQLARTQTAQAVILEQTNNNLIAGTQTAIANTIATQTQAAAATSQWYTDQARQRNEQWQTPINFLWMCCLPLFIVLAAGLALWGFWRWLKIRQANQRILDRPVAPLPIIDAEAPEHNHDDSNPLLESDIGDDRNQIARMDDQVRGWLDEIKQKLLKREKDQDDNQDN